MKITTAQKKAFSHTLGLVATVCLVGCGSSGEESPSPEVSPSPDVTPTVTPDGSTTPTATAVPEVTATPDDSTGSTPTATPEATEDTPSAVSTRCPLSSTGRTVGVISCTDEASEGYVFFGPLQSTTTYLIDRAGQLIHSWPSSSKPGQAVHLLDDGSILRTEVVNNSSFKAGAAAGRLQIIDWDGNVTWDWTYSSSTYLTHHDAMMMPNGNVLVLSWEVFTKDQAIAMGRNPSYITEGSLWGERILEVKKTGATTGEIVWAWSMMDHVVQDYSSSKSNYGDVSASLGKVDLNYIGSSGQEGTGADWAHFNSIDYNEALDQIVVSSRYLSEVYVIDHSTTTEEAATSAGGTYGKGGDILYRYGNPGVYRSSASRLFYGQHSVHWIPDEMPGAGHLMVYNNGISRPGNVKYSSVDEWQPTLQSDGLYSVIDDETYGTYYGPTELSWQYTAANPADLYSDRVSGARRMENNHTLVGNGADGSMYEVTNDGSVVWTYVSPVKGTSFAAQGSTVNSQDVAYFRAYVFQSDFSGFAGRTLTPGGTLETGD